MNRLTIKTDTKYITNDTKCMNNKYITKLGRLEDLEEENGCPLEALVKFSKQSIVYTKYGVHKEEIVFIDFRLKRIYITNNRNINDVYTLYFDDYKKTWWLKEDRSE